MIEKYIRKCLEIRGAVQGVGFRPYIYRLAKERQLSGWVTNSTQGVTIEIEGSPATVQTFVDKLPKELPPLASIEHLQIRSIACTGDSDFRIIASRESGKKTARLIPDVATCDDCRREIFDSNNRRYLYPFTNCTNCGPRFTIIQSLPYDRVHTTMSSFNMCNLCLEEYQDPLDRRFHAQPNACSQCGPQLELWDKNGKVSAQKHSALVKTVQALKQGAIVAVKGLGGFHLMVNACDKDAVHLLRQRKKRPAKPFAVMFPSRTILQNSCNVSSEEQKLLESPQAPIVLLMHKENSPVADNVAPDNPTLGVMLPYTPLHHILLDQLQLPVVATSANISEEPIVIEEHQALEKLDAIADLFLVHNRPIARHADDSIARIVCDRPMILRNARGYAPTTISSPSLTSTPLLAVGGQLKNTIAISAGDNIIISQHLGDLDSESCYKVFDSTIDFFHKIYQQTPQLVACDMHPHYLSTHFAENLSIKKITVQHHYAHALACMAEHRLTAPALAIVWDGTGYGLDHTIWGGEFLTIEETSFQRMGHWRPFPLIGGDKAVREPKRVALAMLFQIYGSKLFDIPFPLRDCFEEQQLKIFKSMLEKKINSPMTSSAGRLFDAIAALCGFHGKILFEGQAAINLEFAARTIESQECYPLDFAENVPIIVNWRPMLEKILEDLKQESPNKIAAKFHNTLAQAICIMAKKSGQQKIILAGGCFQNKYLLEKTVKRLQEKGHQVFWPQIIPPNDGAIALGQAIFCSR